MQKLSIMGNHSSFVSNWINPGHDIRIESGSYIVRFVKTCDDLTSILDLRTASLNREFSFKRDPIFQSDVFDLHSKHLIVENRDTNELLASCRLTNSGSSKKFQASLHFDLNGIFRKFAPSVEINQFLVKWTSDDIGVNAVLWQGIEAYLEIVQAQALFSSEIVNTRDPYELARFYTYLGERDLLHDQIIGWPHSANELEGFKDAIRFSTSIIDIERQRMEKLIRPSMEGLFRRGAKVSSLPAFNSNLKCAEVITVLPLLSRRARYHYPA